MMHRWLSKYLHLGLVVGCAVQGTFCAGEAFGLSVFSTQAEKLFAQGIDAYRKGDYERARDRLQQLLEFPTNQRSSAAQLVLSTAAFRLGDYGRALEAAKQLQRRHLGSRYTPYIRLIAGDSYHAMKRYYEAATQYSRILATPANIRLQASAAERLAAIVSNGSISPRALDSIRMSLGEDRLRDALRYGEARWYARLGWFDEGANALQTYIDETKNGIFNALARAELNKMHEVSSEQVSGDIHTPEAPDAVLVDDAAIGDRPKVGMLLPLSGPMRQYGEDLLDGARLANREADQPFQLVARDIGFEYDLPVIESEASGLLRTIAVTRNLTVTEEVVAIIGPIFSTTAVAAGVASEAAGIPLIAPLAQQSDLDAMGEYVFQLNVIPEIQGRILGEFATLALGFENLAVVAPLTDYGWRFEREFADSARANGGNIVYTGWYVPGETTDFKLIFDEMRQAGFRLMPPPVEETETAEDSLLWLAEEGIMTDPDLPPLAAEAESDEEEAPPDSSEIFIDTIDAVLVIVESFSDAKTIAPQLRFHRLETQILGNDLWYEPEAIRQLPRGEQAYVENTIFASRYYDAAPDTRTFTDQFRLSYGRDPGVAAFGYDAAHLLVNAWKEGNQSPGALRDWLEDVRDYPGASGRISFVDGRRTNKEIGLLKIARRGRVRPLDEEDLPDLSPPLEEEGFDLPEADFEVAPERAEQPFSDTED